MLWVSRVLPSRLHTTPWFHLPTRSSANLVRFVPSTPKITTRPFSLWNGCVGARADPSCAVSAMKLSSFETRVPRRFATVPTASLPVGVTVLPAMVKTETLPSLRFATSARVPAWLIEIPDAPAPALSVAITAGGFASRSLTLTRLSGTSFPGSLGSSFRLAATSAIDSSGAIATFCGGPATLDCAFITSPRIVGGDAPRSMIVTVSSAGLARTVLTPFTGTALPSFDDTAICA